MNRPFGSWGRYPQNSHHTHKLLWSTDPLPPSNGQLMLAYGFGRSYGDSCQNNAGTLLLTQALNHFLAFDQEQGLLRCESGVSLDEVLKLIVPYGYFLPTTPGTKFITVGGALANDVHGKNHHRAGTFGCAVTQFELLRSNGERLLCSPELNPEWFRATVGGLGLTGLITWVEFKLRRIESAFIKVESLKFRNIQEFFEISAESDTHFEHTVSWLDCLSKGASLGRGILMRGNHAPASAGNLKAHRQPKLSVPCDLPGFALNQWSIKVFNAAYYSRLRAKATLATTHYDPFFYPLDVLNHWNRIYGRRGFFQYQFVVPFAGDQTVIREILGKIAASGQGSFLAVLKAFGNRKSPGLLSFPREGITLALDIPNRGRQTLDLLNALDLTVSAAGGRLYPAKDARMSAAMFQTSYPEWQEFANYVDPAFSSGFWRRVTGGSE